MRGDWAVISRTHTAARKQSDMLPTAFYPSREQERNGLYKRPALPIFGKAVASPTWSLSRERA